MLDDVIEKSKQALQASAEIMRKIDEDIARANKFLKENLVSGELETRTKFEGGVMKWDEKKKCISAKIGNTANDIKNLHACPPRVRKLAHDKLADFIREISLELEA